MPQANLDAGTIKTSILIPAKNGQSHIAACLQAIYSQQMVEPFEVLIIDSGSTDGTLEIARDFPARIETIPPETFHHARTRNLAANLARGEFLVFLSQDAIPASSTWLNAMIGNFRDPEVGAVYGRQLPSPGAPLERLETLATLYGDDRIVKKAFTAKHFGYRYYHFSDANSAIRKKVWEATKFPEDLKVFEDIAIAKRILEAGWSIVYEPQASVFHSHFHTTAGLFKRYFDLGYTMRKLQIWSPTTGTSLVRDAWNLMLRKVSRFDGNGNSRNVGVSLSQDLAKSAGMFLGLYEHLLPLSIKRRMSAFRVYE